MPHALALGPSSADSPAHYLPRADLAHLLFAYLEAGRATDALGRALLQIARGVWDKYHFGSDRDEFCQDCVCHLLQVLQRGKIDPLRNPFSYLSTCAIRWGYRQRSRAAARARHEITYRRAVIEAVLRLYGPRGRKEDDGYYADAIDLPDLPCEGCAR